MTAIPAPSTASADISATPSPSAAKPDKSVPGTKTVPKTVARKAPAKVTVEPVGKRAIKSPRIAPAKSSRIGDAIDQASKKKGAAIKDNKTSKPRNAKLVRDSFTMPEREYELIATVKKRCIAKGLAVKKSEVLRAAVIRFAMLSDTAVMGAVRALEVIKTGRPPKGKK